VLASRVTLRAYFFFFAAFFAGFAAFFAAFFAMVVLL
jgi:hypothetical protein